MHYHYQPPTGLEQRVSHTQLVEELENNDGFLKDPGTVSKSTAGTISVPAGTLVVAIVVTPSADMTISIGTSAGGTQIIDAEEITSGTTVPFVINHYFTGSGTLHFTLSAGTVTVHVKKL